MFQFPPFASPSLCIQEGDTQGLPERVSPFGNLRVKGYLHLTEAYRSLSRPSSPADAKASPMCPCSLPITPWVFSRSCKKKLSLLPYIPLYPTLEAENLSALQCVRFIALQEIEF
jgi:hypothetical protein